MYFLSYSFPWTRFEIEVEPIFGSLALYDVKEKKKVLLVSDFFWVMTRSAVSVQLEPSSD